MQPERRVPGYLHRWRAPSDSRFRVPVGFMSQAVSFLRLY
jgi:hypothetical protein